VKQKDEGALPLGSADDVNTREPDAEGSVQQCGQAKKTGERTHKWVAGRRERVAAWQRPSVALAGRDRRDLRRGETAVTPSHWGDRSGDAARYGKACDQRDKGLVKHHCEEEMEAVIILKAEAALWTREEEDKPLPFYKISSMSG
jgi:hypothetical protein